VSHGGNKAERLLQIEALLLERLNGYTQAELARKIGVNRSTINRYLPDLTSRFAVYETDDGYLRIDREAYRVHVHLMLHEAMAIHLAARLLATRMDKKNPHAAAALRKLGISLERLAPRISEHLARSADVMDDEAQRHDPKYLEVLETLTLAWAEARRVKVWHRSKENRIIEYDFAPYFIEPYAVGQTTHVLGVYGPKDRRITFKLERIERIEATREPYKLPADYDPRAQLGNAWGIWYTDGEPVQVVLKFHPRVARRVKETRWHRNETVTEEPDGYLIWGAKVAEPQEMLPWIRGWGADVEVLGPNDLRLELARETRRLMILYGFEQPADGEQDDSSYDQRRASQLFRKR
jgi:CRISPR-associated endonuclease/helicase Cas3